MTPLLLATGAIATAIVVWAHRRTFVSPKPSERAVPWLRLFSVWMVTWMLGGWTVSTSLRAPGKLLLLIDDSRSMAHVDHEANTKSAGRRAADDIGSPTRFRQVLNFLTGSQLFARLRGDFQVSVFTLRRSLGTHPSSTTLGDTSDLAPTHVESPLAGRLQELLHNDPDCSAVVVFTDGRLTNGPSWQSAIQHANALNVPIFSILAGSTRVPRDLELSNLSVGSVVYVGDTISVTLRLQGTGCGGHPLQVRVRDVETDQTLAERTLQVNKDNFDRQIVIDWTAAEAGELQGEIHVAPVPEEANVANNVQPFRITTLDQPVRVLMLADQPSYEFRMLKRTLGRSQSEDTEHAVIGLRTFLQSGHPEYASTDQHALPLLPDSPQELNKYDVIMWVDAGMNEQSESLQRHVRSRMDHSGCGLVLILGALHGDAPLTDTPWASMIRSRFQDVPTSQPIGKAQLSMTPLGRRYPFLRNAMQSPTVRESPIYWHASCPVSDAGMRVLAEYTNPHAASQPAVTHLYVGHGQMLLHTFDSTWRWHANGASEQFAAYWIQTLRFLRPPATTRSEVTALRTARSEYTEGDAVRLVLTRSVGSGLTVDEVPAAILSQDSSWEKQIMLRRGPGNESTWQGDVARIPAGTYTASVLASDLPNAVTSFHVGRSDPEDNTVPAWDAGIAKLAQETRGEFYRLDEAHALARDLKRIQQQSRRTEIRRPIWNGWWVMTLLVTALTAEWALRRL